MIVQAIFFYLFAAVLVASAVMVIAARNPVHSVLFLILAFVAVASAFMVIAAKNPVYSVLFLIVTFFNAAGLFLLTGAEFLAMILIVVYVGAVAVLFLFVVMMLDVDFAELRAGFARYLPFGIALALVLLGEIIFALAAVSDGPARSTGMSGCQTGSPTSAFA